MLQPQKRLRILFTEGSSTSAREALYVLGPHHTIDVLDSSVWGQCRFSRFVHRWLRCPRFATDPDGYLQFLVQQLKTERYDVLFPTHDQVYLLSRFRDELSHDVQLAVPEFAAVESVMGKANFVRLLDDIKLPQPPTTILGTREELLGLSALPVYLKLSQSTAGQGVRLVETDEQLRQVADQWEQLGVFERQVEVLAQQPAHGDHLGVTGVFQHGRLVAAHGVALQLPNIGGWSLALVGRGHPSGTEHLEQLGGHLSWHGALSLEYFLDPTTDQPQFIECNPRIGETYNAMASGVDLCDALLRVSLGDQIEPLAEGRSGVVTRQAFLILLSRALHGASRSELLTESWKWWRQKDEYANSLDTLTRVRDDWLSLIPATAVALRLLASPRSAETIVGRTVENYSLSAAAAAEIAQQ